MPSQYKITMIVQQTDEQEEFYGSPHKWSMDFDSDLSTDDDLIEEG